MRHLRKMDTDHEACRTQRPFPSNPQTRSRGIAFRLSFGRISRLHPDMLRPYDYDSIILAKLAQTGVMNLIPFLCIKTNLALERKDPVWEKGGRVLRRVPNRMSSRQADYSM